MIRILHLSDPHFGASDPSVAGRFLTQAAGLSPDLTVLSGDLTMRARRSEMVEARRFIERLPRPRLVIPGNHDIPAFNQIFHRFFSPFARYRSAISRNLQPIHSVPGLHVVSINSSKAYGPYPDWSVGRLSRRDLRRADQQLSRAPGSFRVLVVHHPLIAPEDHRRDVVQPLGDLLALIAKHRVDLVLCGHFHRSNLATVGPPDAWRCVVSQAATVCSTRLQGEPPGFHFIGAGAERIEIDRYVFREDSFVLENNFSFVRHPEGWASADTVTRREITHIA